MKNLFIALILVLFGFIPVFAQTSASEQTRADELLQQEESLRQKISGEQKVFINYIMIDSVGVLTEDEIKEITDPFQRQWLSKEDIRQLVDLVSQAYEKKGLKIPPEGVVAKLEDDTLKISIKSEK